MSWSTAPTASDVLSQFTPAEQSLLQSLQGGDNLPAIVTRTIAEIRGAIRSGGYPLDADGTLPLELHADCIAIARWDYLLALPGAAGEFQTEQRGAAAKASRDKLRLIASSKYGVEPPTASTTTPAGRWNSANKVVGRMEPVPRPGVQFPAAQPGRYANDSAPEDAS